MDTTESLTIVAERKHLIEQEQLIERIRRYYTAVIATITPLIAAKAPRSVITRKLNEALTDMVRKTTATIEAGMSTAWKDAEAKTRAIIEREFKELPPIVQDALKEHRGRALQQFTTRKESGMKLSDRVWKTAEQYRALIETELDAGIKEGKPAKDIAKKLREAVNDPSTNPTGRGFYKSPQKNAERLTRTETNMSYRMSDQKGWEANPLVMGYEIKLSASGKPKIRCEVCRAMTGTYPVSFTFVGWHPHCLCYKTPILMSRKMHDKYNRLIAQGKNTPEAVAKLRVGESVKDVPEGFKTWLIENNERMSKWANEPYWVRDNKSTVEGVLDAVKEKPGS